MLFLIYRNMYMIIYWINFIYIGLDSWMLIGVYSLIVDADWLSIVNDCETEAAVQTAKPQAKTHLLPFLVFSFFLAAKASVKKRVQTCLVEQQLNDRRTGQSPQELASSSQLAESTDSFENAPIIRELVLEPPSTKLLLWSI